MFGILSVLGKQSQTCDLCFVAAAPWRVFIRILQQRGSLSLVMLKIIIVNKKIVGDVIMSNTALQLKPICINYSNTADVFYGDKKSVQIFTIIHKLKFPDTGMTSKIMGIISNIVCAVGDSSDFPM